MLEKPEGAIKNGQTRDTGNTGYTRHSTKTNKTNNKTQETQNMSNVEPPKTGGEPRCSRRIEI